MGDEMRWFARFIAIFGALAVWLVGARAEAIVVLARGDDGAVIDRAWVASAVAPGQTTNWIAVSTKVKGRFGLVVPLRAGTQVDFAERAWLDALELGTAPRVMPPADLELPACAADQPTVDVATNPLPRWTLDPVALVTMETRDALAEAASSHRLQVSDAAARALESAAGDRGALLLVYEATDDAMVTGPLRVLSITGEPTVAIGSLRSGTDHDFGVTYFVLGDKPLALAALVQEQADELDVRWHAASGQSDYLVARETRLRLASEPLQLLEPGAPQIFYDWETLPDDGGVVRSVARHYLAAAALDDALQDCLADVVAVREGGLRVARACAPGALVAVPPDASDAPVCGETSELEPVDPRVLRCAGADELAFAHSGLAPDVTISRMVVRAGADFPLESTFELVGRTSDSAVVRADTVDRSDCESVGSSSSGGGPGWIPPDAVDSPGTSSVGGVLVVYDDAPDDDWYWDTTVVVYDDGDSCGGNTEPDDDYEGETCGGDGSGDGCNGDPDDEYDGETCGGDSSDDGSNGETCGGDGSGDGCSGESSDTSSYSGETCGGETADSGYSGETCSGDCSVSRRRRPRLSSLVIALSALLIVLRRVLRPRVGPVQASCGHSSFSSMPSRFSSSRNEDLSAALMYASRASIIPDLTRLNR